MRLKVSFETPLVVIHKTGVDHSFTFVTEDNLRFTGEHMSSTMTAGSHATVKVSWKDATGGAATVDGPTTWTSTDPKMVVVSTDPKDSTTGQLSAPGPVGKCSIHANADADMGAGVIPVTATIDIEVIAGQAVGGDIEFTPDTGVPPKGGTGGTGGKPVPPQGPLTGRR